MERVAALMMNPFKMWEDDTPIENAQWDYYWCCTREWMDQRQLSYSAYAGIPQTQPLVVFPVDQLTAEGLTDSVLTPHGDWYRSKATYEREDPSWETEALGICRSFAGHFAVLAYCHG
ncbi:hypothetical protein [Ralstonia pseudosolanacearum]